MWTPPKWEINRVEGPFVLCSILLTGHRPHLCKLMDAGSNWLAELQFAKIFSKTICLSLREFFFRKKNLSTWELKIFRGPLFETKSKCHFGFCSEIYLFKRMVNLGASASHDLMESPGWIYLQASVVVSISVYTGGVGVGGLWATPLGHPGPLWFHRALWYTAPNCQLTCLSPPVPFARSPVHSSPLS